MKLTTVLGSVNNNSSYYMFIPQQIFFWKTFDIKFLAIFIGKKIPEEIIEYSDNIILWNKNLDLNTAFVAQNIRIFYPCLLNLPDDEMVMITDMDMLPTSPTFYKSNLEQFVKDDFIYYRHIDGDQIYICYNAAHPKTWQNVFKIYNDNDIQEIIYKYYLSTYDGIPGSTGWFEDQKIMYKYLTEYSNLKVLNRPIRRLEVYNYYKHLRNGENNFLDQYDDVHFHRSYKNNEGLILHAKNQLIK
jgi:hypothetical protein